jgi:imidazole glycerol phosphate synthase subunit HisF
VVRKTKKVKTEIQLPVLKSRGNGSTASVTAATETADIGALLASVLRVFAARGRAIREAREKRDTEGVQNKEV